MKASKLPLFALLAIGSGFMISSCSSAVPLAKVQESREIKLPFSEKEFKSNEDFFRVVAHGESASSTLAEKIAMQNAQTNLATRINSLIKNVTEDYSKNISDANSNEFTSSFETQGRVITNETLSMINVLDKKVLQKPNQIYDIWIVIEVSKKSLLEGATKSMSTNKKLQLEADKIRFREIFESEMNKIDR
jgi:hypothetical protein